MIKQMFDVCLSAYDMRVKTGSCTLKPYTILQTEYITFFNCLTILILP